MTSTTFPVSTVIAAMTVLVALQPLEHQETSIVTPASTTALSRSLREQFNSPRENFHSFTSQATSFTP